MNLRMGFSFAGNFRPRAPLPPDGVNAIVGGQL
jgi:hypothetical protein